MLLQTKVEIRKRKEFEISHKDSVFLIGSCFAANIGGFLEKAKFKICSNPYGIAYNPLSIATILTEILQCRIYRRNDLVERDGLFHSFMHHGDFSKEDATTCLDSINKRIAKAHEALLKADFLVVTFGTSFVYEREGTVVSNCHKFPERYFSRRMSPCEELVATYHKLLEQLFEANKTIKIIFTVSPIRHLRNGLQGNQLSKANLLLFVNKICETYADRTTYFPAYEIIMDELRDYRFYERDMTHLTPQAIEYVWERFCDTHMSAETVAANKRFQGVGEMLAHRPLHPGQPQHKVFLESLREKTLALAKAYPYIDLNLELVEIEKRINHLNHNV